MKNKTSFEELIMFRKDAEQQIATILRDLEECTGCRVDEVTYYTQETQTMQGKIADNKFVEIKLCV